MQVHIVIDPPQKSFKLITVVIILEIDPISRSIAMFRPLGSFSIYTAGNDDPYTRGENPT